MKTIPTIKSYHHYRSLYYISLLWYCHTFFHSNFSGDLALFDAFQNDAFEKTMRKEITTTQPSTARRPVVDNLYDVFYNIRADEAEHAITMGT